MEDVKKGQKRVWVDNIQIEIKILFVGERLVVFKDNCDYEDSMSLEEIKDSTILKSKLKKELR